MFPPPSAPPFTSMFRAVTHESLHSTIVPLNQWVNSVSIIRPSQWSLMKSFTIKASELAACLVQDKDDDYQTWSCNKTIYYLTVTSWWFYHLLGFCFYTSCLIRIWTSCCSDRLYVDVRSDSPVCSHDLWHTHVHITATDVTSALFWRRVSVFHTRRPAAT